MKSVLVVHPGLQHAHQLAWALQDVGLLQGLWSGVPIASNGSVFAASLPATLKRRLKRAEIPAHLCKHPLRFPLLYRASRLVPSAFHPSDFAHRADHAFDAWAADRVVAVQPRAVVAYENAARNTFRAAKAAGIRCILDAASLHHTAGARLNPSPETPYLPEIIRRKDEEIALADLILTCSPLAAESYLAAGVAPSKLCAMPLGAALPINSAKWEPHREPLHFVFAGALSQRKSIDIILAAFTTLHSEGAPFRVSFVGGEAEPGWVEKIQRTPYASHIPSMAQEDLFALLASADCLLLPSRYDSFGMVVAEAMACGTPAIVSVNTGAKVMIEEFPGAGWVVNTTVESVLQCLRERIGDRESLFQARFHARAAAQQFTWQAYRHRVGAAIAQWLGCI